MVRSDPSPGADRNMIPFSLRVPILQTRERSAGSGDSPITVSFRLCSINLLFTASLSCRGLGVAVSLIVPSASLYLFIFRCCSQGPALPLACEMAPGLLSAFRFSVFCPCRSAFHLFSFVNPFPDLSGGQAPSQHSVKWIRGRASTSRSLRHRRPSRPRRRRIFSLDLGFWGPQPSPETASCVLSSRTPEARSVCFSRLSLVTSFPLSPRSYR